MSTGKAELPGEFISERHPEREISKTDFVFISLPFPRIIVFFRYGAEEALGYFGIDTLLDDQKTTSLLEYSKLKASLKHRIQECKPLF